MKERKEREREEGREGEKERCREGGVTKDTVDIFALL